MSVVQSISKARIGLVSRRVKSISFSSPDTAKGAVGRGEIKVSNAYKGGVYQPDGEALYRLDLEISVNPEENSAYYAFDVQVSGYFSSLDPDLRGPDIEGEVMRHGSDALYSFAGEVAATLTEDGVLGRLSLPLLEFDTTAEPGDSI